MKGHISRGRVDGTWYLRVELERDGNGTRRQRRETVRGTKAEAHRRLREVLREAESGGYSDGTGLTVAEVAARWLATTEHRVGARTYNGYAAHIRLHIAPTLGTYQVDHFVHRTSSRLSRSGLRAAGAMESAASCRHAQSGTYSTLFARFVNGRCGSASLFEIRLTL